MFAILFTIVLSGIPYHVTGSCKELGGTYFPKDDSKEVRVLNVCSAYGPEQTKQIVEHELLHICMHGHKHAYTTQEELDVHLQVQKYSEEYFANQVAPCLIDNKDKLFTALEKHGVNLQ
jgi:Zn-dependent peptidase ImmA (M78 family)